MLYYATFTTGLHAPVARLVENAGLRIEKLLDGALVYESDTAHLLPSFVNVFAVLSWRASASNDGLKPFMKNAAAQPKRYGLTRDVLSQTAQTAYKTFRIVVSEENKLVSADANVKARLENAIATRTNLTADRGGAGEEFWFLYRREGYVFFLRRLTTHTAYEKILHKGELHPELAYMLNVLSQPFDGSVMLDPFCGYGAIPAARLRHFNNAAVYASDIDEEKVRAARDALRGSTAMVRQTGIDGIPSWLGDGSVDAVVTDPPWGVYDGTDISLLYESMLINLLRVVKRGGIIVVLTSQKTLLRELLSREKYAALTLTEAYDILVSGKKAGVFVLQREG